MASPGMISTVILNWNRKSLLKATIESYLATVTGPYELVVVDNASTDGAVDYLRKVHASGRANVVLLPENIGGLAYNQALHLLHGEFVHLSENDQLFLPGWCEHVRESFAVFPELGQLSLFADVPTDLEAWGPKPSRLRFSEGKILYEAQYNVTTSSILRAEVLLEHGVRITNLEGLDYKFPADGQLSADVKQAGYSCAWSDRYYVRNLGHETAEFEADLEYYSANYASKPWVGVEGWKTRMDAQRAQPKCLRRSAVFPDRIAVAEKTERDVDGKPARIWSMFDTATAEVETLDFLYSLVRAVKPAEVLETGTWLGLSACAIGRALKDNGFGHITTLEIDATTQSTAKKNFEHYDVSEVVTSRLLSSLTFVPDRSYDLLVLNSAHELCLEEFRRFRSSLSAQALVVFCDAAAHNIEVAASIQTLQAEGSIRGVPLATARGIFIGICGNQSRLAEEATHPSRGA